mmetsp:Transcript_18484/g.44509  ORF Transcript_18484/g.44509 Transcript_18484/m.44509 type:complete len:224 (+) Transcript_18484:78-749(+)
MCAMPHDSHTTGRPTRSQPRSPDHPVAPSLVGLSLLPVGLEDSFDFLLLDALRLQRPRQLSLGQLTLSLLEPSHLHVAGTLHLVEIHLSEELFGVSVSQLLLRPLPLLLYRCQTTRLSLHETALIVNVLFDLVSSGGLVADLLCAPLEDLPQQLVAPGLVEVPLLLTLLPLSFRFFLLHTDEHLLALGFPLHVFDERSPELIVLLLSQPPLLLLTISHLTLLR